MAASSSTQNTEKKKYYVITVTMPGKEKGWLHFNEKTKEYIVRFTELKSCVWTTRTKAEQMIQKCGGAVNDSRTLSIEEFVPETIVKVGKRPETTIIKPLFAPGNSNLS